MRRFSTGSVCKVAQKDADRLVCVQTVCFCSEREKEREIYMFVAICWAFGGMHEFALPSPISVGKQCGLDSKACWKQHRYNSSIIFFFLVNEALFLTMAGPLARVCVRFISCPLRGSINHDMLGMLSSLGLGYADQVFHD